MRHDIQFAFRVLRRTPIVTAVAILSLALGIGANTAMFSILDQVLLRGLPVPRPQTLVNLSANGPKSGSNSNNSTGTSESTFSYPMFRDLEAKQQVFTGLAAHRTISANIAYQNQTFHAEITEVSGQYFPVLEIQPLRGRLVGPADDEGRGQHPIAVLSHQAWLNRFGGDERILNQTLNVNGVLLTVVGIAPEGFRGTTLGQLPELFVPISMHNSLLPSWKSVDERRAYWVYLFARLKPGTDLPNAQSSINVLFNGIINAVDAPLQKGVSENYMKRFRSQQMTLSPGDQGQSQMLKEAATPLYMLLAITGFVLLIACANIANLLLARAADRAREISIRLTVGASRGQLIRQLLSEAMLIALAGGAAGMLVAVATSRVILALLPAQTHLPLTASLDLRTLAFGLTIAVATGLLFGLFPALHSTKADLVGSLKDQAGSVSSSKSAVRFRKTLVIAQIGLSLVLLISAGLFLKSLVNISRVELGLRTENVIGFGLSPDLSQYTPARTLALYEQLEDRLAAVPGVTSVGASTVPLLANSNWGRNVAVDGFDATPDTDTNSDFNEIGVDYFQTLSIPILDGRAFTRADTLKTSKVAIVNEAFVKKFSPTARIVGKRMQQGAGGRNDIEIVGVVKNTKYSRVKQEPPPLFFLPYRQDKDVPGSFFYVATAVPAEQVIPAVRDTVSSLDPNLPIEQLNTMTIQVRDNVFVDRMISILATAFAGLATLLAAVGLYGVLAFSVTRRTREIGIRLAIGAETGAVRDLVLREVAVMIAVGAAFAIPAAFGLGRFAESLLFGLKGDDVPVYAAATLVLILVSLAAGYFPARHAMRIDPISALRHE